MKKIKYLFLVISAVTLASFFFYVMGQLIVRQRANIQPSRMANEAKIELEGSKDFSTVFGEKKTDFKKSLIPFTIIYDKDKKPVNSTTLNNGRIPQIPVGVLESAEKSGENRMSWQPESGSRFATVIVPFSDGYIVGGESLSEYDRTTKCLFILSFYIWMVLLVSSIFGSLYILHRRKK